MWLLTSFDPYHLLLLGPSCEAFLQEQGDGDAVLGILSALGDDFSSSGEWWEGGWRAGKCHRKDVSCEAFYVFFFVFLM